MDQPVQPRRQKCASHENHQYEQQDAGRRIRSCFFDRLAGLVAFFAHQQLVADVLQHGGFNPMEWRGGKEEK